MNPTGIMNQSNNRPVEKYSLDLCKFIMAFAVIAIHTDPLVDCSNTAMSRIGYLFLSMAVPFFFLTSGYLLAAKLLFPFSRQEDLSKIRRYMTKILKMYLLWTLLYLPMALWHFVATGKTLHRAIQLYIQGFFFVGQQYNSWPLWYLLSTFYTLGVLYLLLKCKAPPVTFLLVSGISAVISFTIDALIASFTDYTQYGTARTYFYRWNLSSSGNVACLPKTSSSAEQNPASRRMHCQLSDPCICCRCLSSGYYFRQLFWYCRKSFPKKAPYLSFYATFQYDPVSDPHVCLEHLL